MPQFPSFLVCITYRLSGLQRPSLYTERNTSIHMRDQRPSMYWLTSREDILSCLRRTTHPSEKDWVFFVLLRRGLGAEHGKRAVTDGKGSLNKPLRVEAPPNKAFEKYNSRGFFSEFYSSFNLVRRGRDPSIHCKKLFFLTLIKTIPKTMFKESVLKKKV